MRRREYLIALSQHFATTGSLSLHGRQRRLLHRKALAMADPREYFVSSFIIPRYSVKLGQREVDLFHLLSDIRVAGLVGKDGLRQPLLPSAARYFSRSAGLAGLRHNHRASPSRPSRRAGR